MEWSDRVKEIVKEHALAVEKMTEDQLVEAIVQMIKAGDFVRHVQLSPNVFEHRQAVTYIPYMGQDHLKSRIRMLEAALREIIEGDELTWKQYPQSKGIYSHYADIARRALGETE